jgi:hypothetical protein
VHPRQYADYANLPYVCAISTLGMSGLAGATGATGPQGDSGPNRGEPRLVHPDRPPACANFASNCTYLVGPRGDTGETGATGPQGPTGLDGGRGPTRAVHVVVSGVTYSPGAEVDLTNCTLPSTGGRSTGLLPWGLTLLAAGIAVLLITCRRRTTFA